MYLIIGAGLPEKLVGIESEMGQSSNQTMR
jgi:hypothetical protein